MPYSLWLVCASWVCWSSLLLTSTEPLHCFPSTPVTYHSPLMASHGNRNTAVQRVTLGRGSLHHIVIDSIFIMPAFIYVLQNAIQIVLLKYNCINLLRIWSLASNRRSQQWECSCSLLGNKCTSIFNYPSYSYPAVAGCFDVSLRSHWSNLIKTWQCWKTKTRSNCPLTLPCAYFTVIPSTLRTYGPHTEAS